MKDLRTVLFVLLVGAVCLLNPLAEATITKTASGVSAKGVDVTFQAELTLLGDMLTIVLTNDSLADSLNPDDVLGSFYFDIVSDGGDRPELIYESAKGDTYQGVKDGPDALLEAGADLMATDIGDNTWQFKTLDTESLPFLGFGIGAVGNSNLFPNGFNGNIVGGIDYAIYKGQITTQSLSNATYLVKESAVFVFSGLTGFSESDIAPEFAFGLGTAPDSLITPEPATMVLLGAGMIYLPKRRSTGILLQRS